MTGWGLLFLMKIVIVAGMRRRWTPLLVFLGVEWCHATLVTLQRGVDGYTGSVSSRLRDNGLSVGTDDSMYMGDSGNDADNRALLYFDLSAYAGATVTGDGTLTLLVFQVDGNPGSDDFFDVYAVDANNAGWIAAGDSSWNFLDVSESTPWKDGAGADLALASSDVANPVLGGLGVPGEGYAALSFATLNEASYSSGIPVSITIPQSQLQAWIDGPNAGMLFRGRDQTNAGRIAVRHPRTGTVSERPILSFNVIPEPTSGGLVMLGTCLLMGLRRVVVRVNGI